VSGRRKAGDDRTVTPVRSLEDSLAHWSTITSGDAIVRRWVPGDQ
jgi:hypothetical protein